MLAVRLGSYSMAATLAGTLSLSRRLKSMMRYRRLCPPPWCRRVMWPWTLRPPLFRMAAVSFFSGRCLVISAKSETVIRRRPAEVGLYFLIPMAFLVASLSRAALEQLDLVALLEGDDGLLEVGALAHALAHPLDLPADDQGADAGDAHLELGLHRAAHVMLGGVAIDQEGVLPELLPGLVQLLGVYRSFDHVVMVHGSETSSARAAAWVSTTCGWRRIDSTLSPSGGSTSKRARLRTLLWRASLLRSSTTSALSSLSRWVRASNAFLVFGPSRGKASRMISAFSRARWERATRMAPRRTFRGGR